MSSPKFFGEREIGYIYKYKLILTGDLVLCAPPLPIPNREVKAQNLDDSPLGRK